MSSTASPASVTPSSLARVEGPDALTFLNGQFTCDVAALASGRWTWGGYCSPKGRLLATFRLGRQEDAYLLQCPTGQLSELVARLRRYVLRARVTFTLVPGAYRVGTTAAADPGQALRTGELRMHGAESCWGLGEGRAALALPEPDAAGVDWSADLEAGAPWVFPANAEAFVPQMVDLDRAGGVSFEKGCYPGQEVVARARYLGEVKRHLFRVALPAGPLPAAADPVSLGDRAVGAVLYAATTGDRAAALAVIDVDSARSGALHVGGRPVARVEVVHADV